MRVAVFNTKPYDEKFLTAANQTLPPAEAHELEFFESNLRPGTTALAAGFPCVCIFVNDYLNRQALERLKQGGTTLIALRSAGFNHVDLAAAAELGMTVVRVPAYSPYAVAEHTVGLILALNRHIHRAFNRVREGNFALNGLMGFDLHGTTVGIVGTGKIGLIVAQILGQGFGCHILAYDLYPNPELETIGGRYVDILSLAAQADIIALHCPLTPETHHLIDAKAIEYMKPGVMIVNTSRGALIDAAAMIGGLKSGKIGYLGLDVYEGEEELFFEDFSNEVIHDDVFQRLLTFPNVLITGHQAFFTRNAMVSIAETTLQNISDLEQGRACANVVTTS
ncbi:2-hydroxyacid dehydrogenase [Thermosynechococcaceae cyanobacterium BACA0444]|uniref:2-hydroxyacid dehydrogenase n=1 Tax=Pseudocalidococcus azoricus BACA0444 TaxID=2918990 RepID=A0AAE4JVM9_9CYAN|nr:2-hydroxyacid dehydrogenase [Pseudocalidococcus azoricus]MDS3860490.1 2-hydroxyacid dehydrogenase [Pseudocalidococcus azoricus BACA0444]